MSHCTLGRRSTDLLLTIALGNAIVGCSTVLGDFEVGSHDASMAPDAPSEASAQDSAVSDGPASDATHREATADVMADRTASESGGSDGAVSASDATHGDSAVDAVDAVPDRTSSESGGGDGAVGGCEAGLAACDGGMAACAPGYADCDKLASTGCEVNTVTDAHNCGGCGVVCTLANATSTCSGSTCAIASCNPGYANCDKLASTGCEVDTTSSPSNCGGCAVVCNACNNGQCVDNTCAAGFADCDGLASTGCEVDTTSNPNHCGSCTRACAPAQSCVSSSCQCPTGTPTFCSLTNTCVNPTTDAANCATCGHACGAGMTCGNSTCAFRWPDSYDDSSCTNDVSSIPCPTSPGQVGWGEDGTYHIYPPAYALTPTVANDLVTGLTWERNLADGLTTDFTQAQAVAHCQAINASAYGGFADWRLPTAREVATIDDMGNWTGDPNALPQAVFQNLQMNSALWTQTPAVGVSGAFWVLGINWAVLEPYSATQPWPAGVSCVRGAPLPTTAYVVSSSANIVFDPRTNLSWQRAVSQATRTFLQAVAYCNGLGLDGFVDWRLPSYKELFSIVDTTLSNPPIDSTAFPGTPAVLFWSSSAAPPGNTGTQAYGFDFMSGGGFHIDPTTNLYEARCVRGG